MPAVPASPPHRPSRLRLSASLLGGAVMALYNVQSISRHDVGPLLVQPIERASGRVPDLDHGPHRRVRLSCPARDGRSYRGVIRTGTGSNAPLLGQDATQAGERRILGVPLLTSPSVTAGEVWAYDRNRMWTVLREDVTLDVDASRYFESDRVAIRATMRVGFAFGHPQSAVKISAT